MQFFINYGTPYSGTTVLAKMLAHAVGGGMVNERCEGIWEVAQVHPEDSESILINVGIQIQN